MISCTSRQIFSKADHLRTLPLALAALLLFGGSLMADTYRVHYSIRGSGRNVTVQADSSIETRKDRHGDVSRYRGNRCQPAEMTPRLGRNSLPKRLAEADIPVVTTIEVAEDSLARMRELVARRDALVEELARVQKEVTILERRNVPLRFIDREEAHAISDRIFEKHAGLFHDLAAC